MCLALMVDTMLFVMVVNKYSLVHPFSPLVYMTIEKATRTNTQHNTNIKSWCQKSLGFTGPYVY